jgi:hypothetical protein
VTIITPASGVQRRIFVTKGPEPIECKIRVTEGSRMRAYQNNMFVMEFSAPARFESLQVELLQSEQYEISSPNPITVEGFEKGPRKGIFVIRPDNAGTITLNFKIGDSVKTFYASALTENPYVFGEPIKDEHLFFGRVAELSEIHRGVTKRNKQNFLITAPRRAGKTSLLVQLKTRLQYPFISLLLTPEKTGHEHYQMFRSILLHLREEMQESLGEEPPALSWDVKAATHDTSIDLFNFHFERDLRRHLVWLAKTSDEARAILLLDEATFLLADSSPEKTAYDSRQQFLRHLLQSHERIACVLAGTPQILKMTSVTSPLYNIFSGIKLKGFSREETQMLIREPAQQVNVRFEDDAVAKIIEYGGCSPYYTQALCSLSLEHMYDAMPMPIAPDEMLTVTVPHVDAAICRIIDTIDYGLQSVWDGLEPDEREILKSMAASESVMIDQHNRDVIARLSDMNLVTVNEATQFASIQARLDEAWIRQQGV